MNLWALHNIWLWVSGSPFQPLLDEGSQESVMLSSCLQAWQNIINSVWVGFLPWDNSFVEQIIGWPFPRCLLHLYFCASCRGKIFGLHALWVYLYPSSFTESPPCLKQVTMSYSSHVPCYGHPNRLPVASPILVLQLMLQMLTQISILTPSPLLFPSLHTWSQYPYPSHPLSHSVPSLHPSPMTILFSLLIEMHISSLGPSL